MKNILFTLAFLLLSSSILWSQEVVVPQTQMSLINKVAADWCPPCGGWAWDFFHELIDDNSENAILFSIHHSGGLQNSVASNMTSNYGVNSQPRFILNSIDQNVSASNSASIRTSIQEAVNQAANSTPLVQTGLDAYHSSDGQLRVKLKSTFFSETEGEYYLGVYLVEKIVSHMQASQPNPATHKNIVRLEFTGNDFGSLLASGSIASGSTYSYDLNIALSDYDPSNLEIVTIIWKKVDNSYIFENANKDNEIQLQEVTNTFSVKSAVVQMAIKPNLIQETAIIDIELDDVLQNVQLQIVDIQGKVVQNIHQGRLNNGLNQFTFEKNAEMTSGLYFLHFHTGQEVLVRKIILE